MGKYRLAILSLLVFFLVCFAKMSVAQQAPYQDLQHDSDVFGHPKTYRLYLPEGYEKSPRRYPVIYFFHGWGGRHNKDDSAKLEYEKLKALVDKYQVIMVMWDGNIDLGEPRPYNAGDHGDVKFQVQMKDYFPELVSYIDKSYRTLANRDNRGIIGFSMGGFMSLFLSGKYPDMICSAVSMMGSPEFYVGWPSLHTLYPVRYTFGNLQDVQFRVHTSATDILYFLNEEVKAGARWQGKAVQFETFPGGHMVDFPGKTEVFEKAMSFVAIEFGKVHPKPLKWSHYDVYGSFGLWGYEVKSDKKLPGFIFLKNVTRDGFGVYTKKWLPNGPAIPMGPVTVTTAPFYAPGKEYQTATYLKNEGKVVTGNVKADEKGRVTVESVASGSETGIFNSSSGDNWVVADYDIQGASFLKAGKMANKLSLKVFNRGGVSGNGRLRVIVISPDSSLAFPDSVLNITKNGSRLLTLPDLNVICHTKPPSHAEPFPVRLIVKVINGARIQSTELTIPVEFDVPYFTNVKIDDGQVIRKEALGKGNGNGKAEPGESIMLYEGQNRLRIYSENRFIEEQFADEMIPARWPDGFTQLSILKIAENVPAGQEIECLASYETKSFNPIERKVTWGKVKFLISK